MRPILYSLCFLLACSSICRADGIVLPRLIDPKSVRIPDQQALISYVDGIETLVIETRFEGEGAEFAWIVPVPSVPEVSAGTLGTFPSLRAIFASRVKSFEGLGGFILVALFPLALVMDRLFRAGPRRAWLEWVMAPFFLLFLAVLFLPSLGKARSSAGVAGPVVEVLERKVVGAYDVAVLSSSDGDALTGWLAANGFVAPKEIGPPVAQYVKEGWCFVASRLRRDSSGAAVMMPHPLVLEFAVTKPMYPMRLTAHGVDEALELDLYVFGSGTASCEGMTSATTGPVTREEGGWWAPRHQLFEITHPALSRLTRGTMHATKLTGTFKPTRMDKDLVFEFGDPIREMPYVVSHGEAIWAGVAAFVGVSFVTGLVVLLNVGKRRPGQSRGGAARGVLGMGIIAGLAVFFWLPRVDTLERSGGRISPGTRGYYTLRDLAANVLNKDEERGTTDAQTMHEVRTRLREALAGDQRFSEGDGPGQYVLFEDEGKVDLLYVDVFGRAKREWLYTLPGPPAAGSK